MCVYACVHVCRHARVYVCMFEHVRVWLEAETGDEWWTTKELAVGRLSDPQHHGHLEPGTLAEGLSCQRGPPALVAPKKISPPSNTPIQLLPQGGNPGIEHG
jgi:hypothetical protein